MSEDPSSRTRTFEYRGKRFTVPNLSATGFVVEPGAGSGVDHAGPSPILDDLNSVWDLARFHVPRRPIRIGVLEPGERAAFSLRGRAPRTLDLPIKFPGSAFRVPSEFEQFRPVIQRVADAEARLNAACFDEYYAYLTVDQGLVRPGALQREAPCHVDGFQGARVRPKTRINHSYVVSDALPTVYYEQPFDFSALDEAKHNFFWEMNRQVAATKSAFAWSPEPFELSMIDAYTVHRGDAAEQETYRTWLRISFEVRVFDRMGNAHNPLFAYDWAMVPRDIEGLGLVPFDPTADPSLHVFPWQRPDGTPWESRGTKTQPRLR
ncbi:MAG: hypothetical protein U0414_33965 [Polyangiaceae bacterium]